MTVVGRRKKARKVLPNSPCWEKGQASRRKKGGIPSLKPEKPRIEEKRGRVAEGGIVWCKSSGKGTPSCLTGDDEPGKKERRAATQASVTRGDASSTRRNGECFLSIRTIREKKERAASTLGKDLLLKKVKPVRR